MAPKLKTHVHVPVRDKSGHTVGVEVFGPNDRLPDWAVQAISNPAAWVGDVWPGQEAADQAERDAEEAARRSAAGGQGGDEEPPPRNGSGSGVDAWADYSRRHGVEVPAEAKREDIIAALDTAGVRTS